MKTEIWLADKFDTRICPLPDATFEWCEWELNRPGASSIKLDPTSKGAQAIEGIVTEVQIWIDDENRWSGPVWGLSGAGSSDMTVNSEGPLSLFSKRFIDRTSLLYTSLDQWQIAWNLLTYAQSEAVEDYRDFNIDAGVFTVSGVTRSRDYKREEHKNILDCLYEFDSRTLKNGFDWEIVQPSSGGRFWTPYYPRKGSVKTNYAVLWTPRGDQRTITDFSWTESFMELGSCVYVTGGSVTTGSVTVRKEGKYENLPGSAYFGQMQKIISDGTEIDENWLEDRAEQEAIKGSLPTVVTEIQSVKWPNMDPLGNVLEGDWLPVRIDRGRIQVDALHRVEKVRLNGDGTMNFTFGEVVEL